MMPDIKKLEKERPELFDFQDVPPDAPKVYLDQVAKMRPKWLQDRLAKAKK